MTGSLWVLATILGPILLGLAIYYGLQQSEAFGRDRMAVRRQQEAVRRSYSGEAHTGEAPDMPAPPVRGRNPMMIAVTAAVALFLTMALTWYLTTQTTQRTALPQAGDSRR